MASSTMPPEANEERLEENKTPEDSDTSTQSHHSIIIKPTKLDEGMEEKVTPIHKH